MLVTLGFENMDEFVKEIIPPSLLCSRDTFTEMGKNLPEAIHEHSLTKLFEEEYAGKNKLFRTFIGQGYYGTMTPPVIKRCLLENPAWYTPYTPYQAEISQGRLEGLLAYQTMICELTGLPIANASLLDEGTAASEAMLMVFAASKGNINGQVRHRFLVDQAAFPQTISCIMTRAEPLGIKAEIFCPQSMQQSMQPDWTDVFGFFVQNPNFDGRIVDYSCLVNMAKQLDVYSIVAADILSLTLVKTPANMGFDVAVGSSQRFGIPMGHGGPHAAYFACQREFMRRIPGRIVGVSRDSKGKRALRLAAQTREQHIRREKATSNVCTAQALLANAAAMYAIYHGPDGLEKIAKRINELAHRLTEGLLNKGYNVVEEVAIFDTIAVVLDETDERTIENIMQNCLSKEMNLGFQEKRKVRISIDETTNEEDLIDILSLFPERQRIGAIRNLKLPLNLRRRDPFLNMPLFKQTKSETQMMRLLNELASKDLSLVHSMIPLGSCTMKLNSATEMMTMASARFSGLHPFVPLIQSIGTMKLLNELEVYLSALTGFPAISLQPNSGAQGEYAGLRVIREYHNSNGHVNRNICLVPVSAHGTNPASAVMAGLKVVPVKCSSDGSIDMQHLDNQLENYGSSLSSMMLTYPSTFGLFDANVKSVCEKVHKVGGKVYIDGANLNAMVGLIRPADLGADVCHVNLHKTFCIPHGGGGPGMGPIGVTKELHQFIPGKLASLTVSAAPYGSSSILGIPWAYIRMMGLDGLRQSSLVALLNANYIAVKLASDYPILFRESLRMEESGKLLSPSLCAHEFIIDIRPFEKSCGITAFDVAKRLQDYSFHSPTMAWPVSGTLMVEPTECEDLDEMNRFIDAMISIRREIRQIEIGDEPIHTNKLKLAPHTVLDLIDDEWNRPYSKEAAVFPLEYLRKRKFWPTVNRLDDVYGDLNVVCCQSELEKFS